MVLRERGESRPSAFAAEDLELALDRTQFARALGLEPDPWQEDLLRSTCTGEPCHRHTPAFRGMEQLRGMGNYPPDRNSVREPNPLLGTARELGEAKRILEGIEATALSSVAQVLVEVTESLSRTAKDLTDMRAAEWMTAEQAAKHLGPQRERLADPVASSLRLRSSPRPPAPRRARTRGCCW